LIDRIFLRDLSRIPLAAATARFATAEVNE
jgi:hypothetical protein